MKVTPIDATGMTLGEVLKQLGWRHEASILEGRRRIFDQTGEFVNIYTPAETWAELRNRKLVKPCREGSHG